MAIAAADVIPLSQARANLSELADEVKAGAEKIITKNGESYVALIDAERLDYYHRLERERVHLVLLDDIEKGLADIEAGRTQEAREVLLELRRIEKSRAPGRAVSRRASSKVAKR
jgi:prevent-host-death family protein